MAEQLFATDKRILAIVHKRERHAARASARHISRTLDITETSADVLLERLENMGFVYRDARDRRTYHITNTGCVAAGLPHL